MAKSKAPANPFYVLVVLLGIVFAITACAYGTMAYRAIAPGAAAGSETSGLMVFLDLHGVAALAIELALLGVATFGAIGLDQLRSPVDRAASGGDPGPETGSTRDGKIG